MPICISCSTPVKNLYTTYSKADDRSLGKGVRLTQCPRCKRFADKYVEHDFVVLFIDLVLIKPQVYRHLLFNRLTPLSTTSSRRLDPAILRLGILLVLFDVYITWARIEMSPHSNSNSSSMSTSTTPPSTNTEPIYPRSRIANAPILTQYLFFLTMNVLGTLAQHGIIRFLASILVGTPPTTNSNTNTTLPPRHPSQPRHPSPNLTTLSTDPALFPLTPLPSLDPTPHPGPAFPSSISTALLVSSCTKLFPILLVIWPISTSSDENTTEMSPAVSSSWASRISTYTSWAVLLNNVEALLILLDCGYVKATVLAVAGFVARWAVEGWVLEVGGLGRKGLGLGIDGFGLGRG